MARKLIEDIFADHRMAVMAHRAAYERALGRDPEYVRMANEIQRLGLKKMGMALNGEEDAAIDSELEKLSAASAARVETLHLQPYLCPRCRDKEYVDGKVCTCVRRRIYLEHYAAFDPLACDLDLHNYDISRIDNETPDPKLKMTAQKLTFFCIQAAKDLVSRYPNDGRGLLVTGPTGTGKTRIASALAREAVLKGIDTLFIHAIEVNELYYARRMGAPVDLRYLETCGLLIIDDLGTEPKTNNVTDQAIYTIDEKRGSLGLPTVFLTNVVELKKAYSERISSRLYNQKRYAHIPLCGNDLRSPLETRQQARTAAKSKRAPTKRPVPKNASSH